MRNIFKKNTPCLTQSNTVWFPMWFVFFSLVKKMIAALILQSPTAAFIGGHKNCHVDRLLSETLVVM